MAGNIHLIGADDLRKLVARIFVAAGCDAEEAGRIGHHLVSSNLAGHDSHGVARVPRYVMWLRDGMLCAGQKLTVIAESPTHAVVDGNQGFGQTIGPLAVDLGIAKARAAGMAIIALRNTGHIGRIGDWAERAAEAGLVSIHFVNVHHSQLVAPFGGIDRRFSTNPFSVGIPQQGEPLILDFATSLVAEGKVLVAANGGKKLPEGALIGTDGKLSSDPETLYGPLRPGGPRDARNGTGAIRAFGEHKGSGLAFMCELLGGVLTGGGASGPVPEGETLRVTNGMLSIYLDPAHFGAAGFVAEARGYAEHVKTARPVEGCDEVLVPGEPESRTRAARLRDGVPLQMDTWESIVATARDVGVAV